MLALFDKVVREELQIPNQGQVLLAVSGGVDSMCLLDLFVRKGQPVAIAHVNYGLRGAESDQDEALVEKFAETNGIRIHVHKAKMDKSRGGIQEQARIIRYAWFKELQEEFGYNYIATAHHLDDQIETFMINMIRGTGIDGLSGIQPKRNNIIRPLLKFNKDQIYKWVKENKIPYREDRSNETDDYLRNRIRHHITPFLLDENTNFYDNFQRTLDKLHQTNLIQSDHIAFYKNKIKVDRNQDTITLSDLPDHAFDLILFSLLKAYGINWEQVLTISSKRNKSGLTFESQKYNFLLDKGELIIRLKKTPEFIELIFNQLPAHATLPHNNSITIKPTSSYESDPDQNKECIDGDKIKWPIKIRRWKDGDSFAPLGMNGQRQKLQDYFTNNKINRFDKKDILILEDQESIIWIVGHRLSDKVKITKHTTSYAQLQFITP